MELLGRANPRFDVPPRGATALAIVANMLAPTAMLATEEQATPVSQPRTYGARIAANAYESLNTATNSPWNVFFWRNEHI